VLRLGPQLREDTELGGVQVVPVVLLDSVVNRGDSLAVIGIDVDFAALEAPVPLAQAHLAYEHGFLETRPTRMSHKRLWSTRVQFLDESDILSLPFRLALGKFRPRTVHVRANATGQVLEVDVDEGVELEKVLVLAVKHLVLASGALFRNAEHNNHHGVWKQSMDVGADIRF